MANCQKVSETGFSLFFCQFRGCSKQGEKEGLARSVFHRRLRGLHTLPAAMANAAGGDCFSACGSRRISTAENGVFCDEMGCFCYLELSIRPFSVARWPLIVRKYPL